MYKLYHCGRCGETFWVKNQLKIACPSCGNSEVSKKELHLDLNNRSMTLNNVVHGVQDRGIVRINISGERRKALFSCNSCGLAFEADCTDGLQVVSCPECHEKDFEVKSPIVSVIGGVHGLPTIKQNWTKAEIKAMKFAKSCLKKRIELQNAFEKISSLMKALEIPEEHVSKLEELGEVSLQWLEEYHEQKIRDYQCK